LTTLPARLAFAAIAPLLLLGCLLTPGKFVSSLKIDADRNFAFTYKGEVIAVDMAGDFSKGLGSSPKGDEADDAEPADAATPVAQNSEAKPDESDAAKRAETDAKNRAIADALRKEAGYRSVDYVGDGKFMIDYAIWGTLDHSFIYPFNVDAEIVLPFIAVELRANDTVRVRAPAFANEKEAGGPAGMSKPAEQMDGVFTLDTDAEIVSQNNEDGAKTVGGRKIITWRATPLTKDAPTAVLKMAPRK